ncbi:alpha-ketoglutarate-dependent dioxygenase AlkB [Psychromonas sp.]|uniref:alpha-ketoglutarate-dependent dioxygenase AlkB family protein n=1 Tax=Psychromonas sp. TaxID=1884585 RepID=UPI00356B0248
MITDLFADDNGTQLIDLDGRLIYWPSFLRPDQAESLYHELLTGTKWQQEALQIYGKMINQPRLTAWYGEYGATAADGYRSLVKAQDFTSGLLHLKNKIEKITGHHFNSVLANLYRNGQDSVAYHADDEAILGINPAIASYSLGAERRFLLKHKQQKIETVKIALQHNSLLLMDGSLQHHWLHSIAKTKRPVEARINLTFRFLIF